GAIAGGIVVFAVELFEKLSIDDPVGAISVHGVCGLWGTLAVALFHVDGFSGRQLVSQFIGITTCFFWTFGSTYLLFQAIKRTIGLRVSEEDERDGLDISEHGGEAYPVDHSVSWAMGDAVREAAE